MAGDGCKIEIEGRKRDAGESGTKNDGGEIEFDGSFLYGFRKAMKNPDSVGVFGGYFFEEPKRIFLMAELVRFEGIETDVVAAEKFSELCDLCQELGAVVERRSEEDGLTDCFGGTGARFVDPTWSSCVGRWGDEVFLLENLQC